MDQRISSLIKVHQAAAAFGGRPVPLVAETDLGLKALCQLVVI